MNEKVNITQMDGNVVAADIICYLEKTDTSKKYAYYTLNETVGVGPSSTVKIYVAKIKQDNPALDTPITDDDWHVLKDIMSDSIKGVLTPNVKYLPLSELNPGISVSERAIAMPTSYDYINKQRGLYAEQIATATPTPEANEPIPTVPEQPTVVEEEKIEQPSIDNLTTPPIAETIPEPTVAPIEEPAEVPKVEQPAPIEPIDNIETDTSDTSTGNAASVLKPIDLAEIETKYAEMVANINKLKEQEIEAAKRYNATLQLNDMHTEQHASYVQQNIKETIAPEQQVVQNEPSAVTPFVPEPAVTPQNIETNWFDMPNN